MLAGRSLCLGCMGFGSRRWRPWVLDEDEALPLLDAAVDAGIAAFDTANAYSGGESERILGRFVRSRGLRDDVLIATKLYWDTPDRLGIRGLGRDNVIGSAEASLERLGIERIDLLQIHQWDPDVPIEETLAAFDTLIRAGKVAAIGATNLAAWQLAKAALAAQAMGAAGFTAIQPHWNLLYREDERELIPLARDRAMALLPWSPLARGRLARSGATARGDTDDVADALYGTAADAAIVAALGAVAAEVGAAPATVALAWLIGQGATPVVGATRAGHIADAGRAMALRLDAAQVARLEASYVARPAVGLPTTIRNQTPTEELT